MKNKKIINSFNRINCQDKEELFKKIITKKEKRPQKFVLVLTTFLLAFLFSSYPKENADTTINMLEVKQTENIFIEDTCYTPSSKGASIKEEMETDLDSSKVYSTNEENVIIIEVDGIEKTYEVCN